MLPRLFLVAAATIGLVYPSYVGDEYWSTVGFDGQLKDGRTTADFLPFERVDREGRRHLDAYVAYWITRTKYDPRQHYEAFGQAWIEDDGRICGRFVGYDRERVELCAGFRVLSKHATRNEPSPFKWVRGDEADLEHTVGFRDHRAAKLEWLGGEIFYGDARLSDKNFQGISPNYQQLVEIANPLEFTKKVSVLAKTTPDEASPRAPPAQPPAERPYDPYDREPARPAEPPKQPEPKPAIGEGAKPPPPKGYVYVRVPKQRTQTPTVVYVDRTGRIVGYGVRPVSRFGELTLKTTTFSSNITYVNPHTARDAYAPQWRSGSSIQWGPGGAQWVGIRQGQQPAPAAGAPRETPEGGEPKETKPVVDQRYSIPSYPAARSGYPYYPYAVPYAQPQVQPQPANPQRYLQRLQPARPPVEARAVQPEIVPLAQLKQQHARGQLTDERPRWQQRPDEEQPPVKTASKEDWLNSQRPVPLERRPPPPPPQGPPKHGKLPEPNESEYEDEDGEEDDGADYTKQ